MDTFDWVKYGNQNTNQLGTGLPPPVNPGGLNPGGLNPQAVEDIIGSARRRPRVKDPPHVARVIDKVLWGGPPKNFEKRKSVTVTAGDAELERTIAKISTKGNKISEITVKEVSKAAHLMTVAKAVLTALKKVKRGNEKELKLKKVYFVTSTKKKFSIKAKDAKAVTKKFQAATELAKNVNSSISLKFSGDSSYQAVMGNVQLTYTIPPPAVGILRLQGGCDVEGRVSLHQGIQFDEYSEDEQEEEEDEDTFPISRPKIWYRRLVSLPKSSNS